MMKRAQLVMVLAAFCGAGLMARLGWTQQAEFPTFLSPGADASDAFLPAQRGTSEDVLPSLTPALPRTAVRSRAVFNQDSLENPLSRTAVVPPTPAVPGNTPTPPTQKVRPRRVTKMVPMVSIQMEPVSPEEVEADKSLRNAMETLKSGKDEESRNRAKEIIHAALAKQFDHDFARREQELVDLEQRVTMLRRQLEKRKAAKDSIVELRLQTLVNESEGLGFPEAGVPELNRAFSPIPVDPYAEEINADPNVPNFPSSSATLPTPSATSDPFRPSGLIPDTDSAPAKLPIPGLLGPG